MGFFRQEYRSELPFLLQGVVATQESGPASPVSLALQADSFPAEPLEKPLELMKLLVNTPVSFVGGQMCPYPNPGNEVADVELLHLQA